MSKNREPQSTEALLKSKIRDVADYPKPGIVFRDITPLLKDSVSFNRCIDDLAEMVSKYDFDYVAGIEARGFIVGSLLAYKLGKGFVLIRKQGKLPYKTVRKEYALEYGTSALEMHKDSLEKKSRVLIVDDLLATGGTANASAELVKSLGARVVGFAFLIELSSLNGRKKLKGYDIEVLARY